MSRLGFSTVSAAALSLALAAAPVYAQGFSDAAQAGLAELGIRVPVESLTTEDVAQITNVLNSTDADSIKRDRIEGILGQNQATATGLLGVAQMRDSAAANMSALGMDSSVVDSMTLAQLGQVENVFSSTDSNDIKRARIEEIVGGEATETGRLGVSQLQDSVSADLASIGVDTENVDMLTVSQLGQIENVFASTDTDDIKRARIEEIMAQ